MIGLRNELGKIGLQKKRAEFELNGIITFCMLMLANVLGVVFQIAEGRIINDPVQYADLNSLLSFQSILALPMTAITMIVSRYVAQYSIESKGVISGFISWIYKPVIVISLLISILGMLFSTLIGSYLNIDVSVYVIETVISAGIGILYAISMGGLQGMQLFFLYGLLGLVGPISKIIAVMLCVFFENKIGVTLLIMIAGNVATVIIGYLMLRKQLIGTDKCKWTGDCIELARFSLDAFLLNVAMTIVSNLDLFLIKHYFNETAGYYSTALVLGKIVTYFTAAIVVVLFPLAVVNKNDIGRARKIFHKSVLYCTILSVACVIALNFKGQCLIELLFGNAYIKAVELVLPVSVMVLPTAFLSVMMNFSLAQNRTRFITLTIMLGGIIEVCLTAWKHISMKNVIWQIAIILWIIMLINWLAIECNMCRGNESNAKSNGIS